MVELTLDDYKERESIFWKKYFAYLHKTIEINNEENEFIKSIDDGESFSDKSDIYFSDEKYKSIIQKFTKKRQNLRYRYKGFTSRDPADFYTELTDEAIIVLHLGDVAKDILERIKEHKNHLCYIGIGDKTIYKLLRGIVTVGDYYYEVINVKDNTHKFYTGCGSITFVV